MKLETITPIKALNKAYYKQSISRKDIELFKAQLKKLFQRINEKETEEHLKNILADFLKDVYYKDKYEINTKDRKDLVIHNGKTSSTPVAVIIEMKKLGSPEMISKEKPNNKALHELMLYYIVDRFEHNNKELKYLIATDIYNWYIFDATLFERFFAKHQNFVESYKKWKSGMLVDKTTQWFYKEIAKEHLYQNIDDITASYFNLKIYENKLDKIDTENEEKLADLYKILSPVHLLKQPFVNDSNNLNKEFYNELLHILGLEEEKQGSKKLIKRKDNGDEGSLIENTINELEVNGILQNFKDIEKFGISKNEQLFNIALELCITWLNRILFLKLLESQLISYNKNKQENSFLNAGFIKEFDELKELFFEVLAVIPSERSISVNEKFKFIPYLNSALFEISELEKETLHISGLKDRLQIPIYNNTVLKDSNSKRLKGSKKTLHYLFEFLDAYDFSSENSDKIQEQNKTIINASVLGLIFEKINGYKEGSYFTPGYITMYICRETVRKAVVEKFNSTYKWNCSDFNELFNKIENIQEANELINDLKICDPAVGSGHFLVSALNEIIAIKSELKILCDKNHKRIREWKAEVQNDELVIYNDETGEIFEYRKPQTNINTERQQIQETFFHEKQTIIENCLFGVDINPNSVKICRLRLWIELLKNSYYTLQSNYSALETLPNIDINIKEGNSLLSRFNINKTTFSNADKDTFEIYKTNVSNYKNEKNKNRRFDLKKAIEKTKSMFKGVYEYPFVKEKEKIEKLTIELHRLNVANLFGEEKTKKEKDKIIEIETEINWLASELKNKILAFEKAYSNAFEWRFEFPEVLNADGKFIGFDVIIANPPYKNLQNIEFVNFELTKGNNNAYIAFIELSTLISQNGLTSMIIPNTWMSGNNFLEFRSRLLQNKSLLKLVQLPYDIFEVYVDTVILQLDYKNNRDTVDFFKFNIREEFDENMNVKSIEIKEWLEDENKTIFLDNTLGNLLKKYRSVNNEKLDAIADVQRGSLPPSQSEMHRKKTHNSKKLIPWFNHQVYRYFIEKKEEVYVNYATLKENKPLDLYKCEKILGRQLISRQFRLQFTYLDQFYAFKKNLYAIYNLNKEYKYLYLLAILNSKFFSFVQIQFNTSGQRDDFPSFSLNDFRNFLIPQVDTKKQNVFVKLVNQIIKTKSKDPQANIDKYEKEIDRLVYELYGLTEEEIKVVEGG